MKALKKLSCVLLAVLLLMSLSVNAFAASNGSTVSSKHTLRINDDRADRVYKAYQIFTGSYALIDNEQTLGDVKWGANVLSSFQEGKDDIAKFVESNLKTADDARKLADDLYPENITGDGIGFNFTDNKYVAEVDSGYYLIVDVTGDGNENAQYTEYIVQVVDDQDITIKTNDTPEFEKKVQDKNDSTGTERVWQDSADYDVGDKVPFQLTATLPSDYDRYRAYHLVFHDTLDAGLTFDVNSVEVYLGDTLIENEPESVKYSVNYSTDAEGKTTFTVTFDNLKTSVSNAGNESKITVKYSATVNDAAVKAVTNKNTAYLEYSNNPNWDATGDPPTTDHTPDDTVVVFTFNATVNKIDQDENALEGAAFKLEKYVAGAGWTTIKEYEFKEEDHATSFSFDGLDDGIYRLTETRTPEGYNSIDPIEFQVVAVHDEKANDPQLKGLEVNIGTYNEDEKTFTPSDSTGDEHKIEFTRDVTKGSMSTDIVNQKGLVLPETGGIGTTIFYVVGGLLIAAALVLLITKKRMTKEG